MTKAQLAERAHVLKKSIVLEKQILIKHELQMIKSQRARAKEYQEVGALEQEERIAQLAKSCSEIEELGKSHIANEQKRMEELQVRIKNKILYS